VQALEPDFDASYPSIAIGAEGLPVIAHSARLPYLFRSYDLRVIKCGNLGCTAGNVSTTLFPSVDRPPSIAIGVDGLPVISDRHPTDNTLRVTHCGNPSCTSGNVSVHADAPGTGNHSSIAIGVDGLPVISHTKNGSGHWALRVTKCGNPTCSTAESYDLNAPPTASVGLQSSIAIGADGRPVISHRRSADGVSDALRITKCGNAACSAWNESRNVDAPAGADVGGDSSIAIGADGLPVISHRNSTAGVLRVTKCGDPACSAGNVSRSIGDGRSPTLAIGADGLPAIAYTTYRNSRTLRVTKCGTPTCG
jgi:hypothetical protein